VLDELAVPPGRLTDVRKLIDQSYRPGAEARGLHLEMVCITPPIPLDDEPTSMVLWWSLDSAPDFWSMKRKATADPGVAAFWGQVDAIVASRSRRFLTPLDEAVDEAADEASA
jgi:hypothetical protein